MAGRSDRDGERAGAAGAGFHNSTLVVLAVS